MTTAIFRRNGNSFEITVNGHAGYNPGGPDIVCAACSTLTYTLLQAVLALEASGGMREIASSGADFHIGKQGGSFYLGATVTDWALPRMETVVRVIADGFALLEQAYPAHVRMTT